MTAAHNEQGIDSVRVSPQGFAMCANGLRQFLHTSSLSHCKDGRSPYVWTQMSDTRLLP